MHRRTALPLAVVLISLWTVPASLAAAEKDTSDYWIQKLSDFYAKSAPYALDYSMTMNMSQQGATLSITAAGDILYVGPERMRANIDMTMAMDALPEPMKMTMLMVHDGETIWTEVDNPMAGGKQVMKVSAEAAKEMQSKAGFGGGIGSDQLDPAAQARMLAEMMDLAVTGVTGGEVRLQGTMTEKAKANLGSAAQFLGDGGLDEVVLVLDEATGALRRMTMGDPADPLISMDYKGLKQVATKDLPPGAFEYTPPEGVAVQDLSQAMLDAQAGNQSQKPEPEAAPAPVQ